MAQFPGNERDRCQGALMDKSKIDPSNIDPKFERTSETTWIISLEEDPETGDVILPFPPELLETQGWKEGDELTWGFDELTGTASLTKKPL